MRASLLVLLLSLALAQASLESKTDSSTNLLPKVDVDQEKVLELDEEGSGDDQDYDDDDYYYYDEDDDYEEDDYEESSGDDVEDDDDVDEDDDTELEVGLDKEEDDLHFEENKDILFEYYNEIYEDDYEIPEDVQQPAIIIEPSNTEKVTPLLSAGNLLLMVGSGLASFAIFTLAFVLCCLRRQGPKAKGSNLPFVIDATSFKTSTPASSIVKNYQRVPTSTKEFLHGMENSTHILKESGQRGDSDKPLLP